MFQNGMEGRFKATQRDDLKTISVVDILVIFLDMTSLVDDLGIEYGVSNPCNLLLARRAKCKALLLSKYVTMDSYVKIVLCQKLLIIISIYRMREARNINFISSQCE